jgi:hypothetical protein
VITRQSYKVEKVRATGLAQRKPVCWKTRGAGTAAISTINRPTLS